MNDLIAYVVAMDGRVFAGLVVGFFAFLIVLPGLIVRLAPGEPRESLSERHERLDAEAKAAANVAAYDSMPKEALR